MKYAYILIDGAKGYYSTQTLISILSLRKHEPDAFVSLVADKATIDSLWGTSKQLLDLANEIKIVEIDDNLNQVEKSRFLKTSLRLHIDGDFLFLDSDTLVMTPLSQIQENSCDIGAVYNKHKGASESEVLVNYIKISGRHIEDYKEYFNSGVMWVRDNERTRKFYTDWHRLWNEERQIYGLHYDQPTMGVADKMNNYVIKKIDPRYNCQFAADPPDAINNDPFIIHYYMSSENVKSYFPLNQFEVLTKINKYGVSKPILEIMEHPLDFFGNYKILTTQELVEYNNPMALLGRRIGVRLKWTNSVARFILKMFGKI